MVNKYLVFTIFREKASVVTFLDDNKSHRRFVSRFQFETSFANGRKFPLEHLEIVSPI